MLLLYHFSFIPHMCQWGFHQCAVCLPPVLGSSGTVTHQFDAFPHQVSSLTLPTSSISAVLDPKLASAPPTAGFQPTSDP